MSITPEAIIQVAEIGVLIGIFTRLGRFGEAIESLKRRTEKLESHVYSGGYKTC